MTAAGPDSRTSFGTTEFRRFIIYWVGQFTSLTGSAISGFALLLYVYIKADSVLLLGWAFALPLLPFVLASPFAGALVDRWGAKTTLVAGNVGQLANMAWLGAMVLFHMFAVWEVYVVVCVASVFKAMTLAAFETSIPLMVPKEYLGRANSLRMMMTGMGAVIGPVVAGILLPLISIEGVILLDCATFVFALAVLAFTTIPRVRVTVARTGGMTVNALLRDSRDAWRYITARRGLVLLLVLLCIINFGIGTGEVLLPPIVLAFSSTRALGAVFSMGAVGMIVFSIALGAWPRPIRYVRSALVAAFVFAGSMILAAVRPNVAVIAVAAFLFLGTATLIIANIQTLWQVKTVPDMLGRTAALKNGVMVVPQAVGNALAGELADAFKPLVGVNHVRSPFVAALVGNGHGRGFSLLLMLAGLLIVLLVLAVSLSPRLRHVQDELPDAIPDLIEDMTADVASAAGPTQA
jgi:DHA3 family macrolide efflux protein-like MFS transporter